MPKVTQISLFWTSAHGYSRSTIIEVASKSSLRDWLHELGFSYQLFSKWVYLEGYERPDVISDRVVYLKKLEILESRM